MSKKPWKKRPHHVVDNMIIIELTQGKSTIIDKEDWEKVKDYRWYAKKIPRYKDKYHAMSTIKKEDGTNTTITLHRLIMDAPENLQVDHVNHEPLDNRKENLRLCTSSENAANREKHRNNKSGYTGVVSVAGGWVAQLTCAGERITMGPFETKEEAARAYDRKKLEEFGAFAKTNGMEHYVTPNEKHLMKIIRTHNLKISLEELMRDDE